MKYVEFALILVCITLSMSVIQQFNLIPTTVDTLEEQGIQQANRGEDSMRFRVEDNGTITCDSPENTTEAAVCKVKYFSETEYNTQGQAGELSGSFGFSDIVRSLSLFGSILWKAIIRIDLIFDFFVPKHNPAYALKYFFAIPIWILYVLGVIELISGRQMQNY